MPFHQTILLLIIQMLSQRSMPMVYVMHGGALLTEETGRQGRGQGESSVGMWGRTDLKKLTLLKREGTMVGEYLRGTAVLIGKVFVIQVSEYALICMLL